MAIRCSRCARTIGDALIRVENSIQVFKVSDTGVLVPYSNLSEPTSELLCPECFEKYAQCLDELNKEYNGAYIADMVEVIDDIQYGDD